MIAKLGQDKESLAAKVEELGKPLRERLATKTDPAHGRAYGQTKRSAETGRKHKARIAELEEKTQPASPVKATAQGNRPPPADILKKRDQRELSCKPR